MLTGYRLATVGRNFASIARLFATVSMSTPSLLGESNASGSLVTITLNRPKALNSLDKDMCSGILDTLKGWESGTTLKPVAFLVKGAGEKAFCAGGDVKSIWDEIANGGLAKEQIGIGQSGLKHSDFFRTEYHMNYALGTSSVPQVSIWDGFVMGGGVGVSVLGRFRVATDTTMFSMPETAIGLFPDVGSSSWLPHLQPEGFGMFIGLTGARLFAADLLSSGIATHYVDKLTLPALEKSLGTATSTSDVERDLRMHASTPPSEKSILQKHGEAISRCFMTGLSLEGIFDALRVEAASGGSHVEWATTTLATLEKMSPTSLRVTHELLQRGAGLSLKDCLIMEFRASQRCMRGDFAEGIRALLVDRDNSPKWAPAATKAEVESFFNALPAGNDLKL